MCLILTEYISLDSTFKGLSQDGDGRIFLKTFAPLSLMTTYRMSLISAGSISLDSTFKSQMRFQENKIVGEFCLYADILHI